MDKINPVLLWDIDGTLLSNDVVNTNKHLKATNHVLKLKLSTLEKSSGMTDLQIIERLYGRERNSKNKKKFDQILVELDKISEVEIKVNPPTLNINIEEVIIELNNLNYKNGIVTGNTDKRCKIKLISAGIYDLFEKELIFSGSNFNNRDNLVKFSQGEINRLGYSKIIIVGDTPLDVIAAKKNMIKVVAVATGKYTIEDLNSFQPDLTIINLKKDYEIFMNFVKSN
jgi:phosphoglycolate phosphatase